MVFTPPKIILRPAVRWPLALLTTILSLAPLVAHADVVVVANRTRDQVPVRIIADKLARSMTIPAGRQVVLSVQESCQLLYDVSGELIRYQLDTNSVYFFAFDDKGWLDLHRVDLGGDLTSASQSSNNLLSKRPSSKNRPANISAIAPNKLAVLPIKILVDNHDPRPRKVWETNLRKRIARVSKILQQHCRLQLKIVAVETWNSGDRPMEFKQTLADFRKRVDPHPGRLAIGFTGRYQKASGRVDLGVTQGMLQSHILIREWAASMSEPERAEVLLHEIGHYLGAVHSPDTGSVMRPVLADDKAIHNSFHVGFDPVNTLIINLVSDEIRTRKTDSVSTLTQDARRRLTQVYEALLKAAPNESSIRQYLSQLNMAGGSPLTYATRLVVREVRRTAESQRRLVAPISARPAADQLTELYVRRAAVVAKKLPRDIAPAALILGLGIALDDSETLLSNPITAGFCRKVETVDQRRTRQRLLGRPTLRGRRDLAQHFFLSAYLTAVVGAPTAEAAGLAKELADSRSKSGFSYRDLAADMAGVHFAQRLLDGTLSVNDVACGFAVVELMPAVADLPEGVPWSEISPQLKSRKDHSVAHYRTMIQHRVHRLSVSTKQTAAFK